MRRGCTCTPLSTAMATSFATACTTVLSMPKPSGPASASPLTLSITRSHLFPLSGPRTPRLRPSTYAAGFQLGRMSASVVIQVAPGGAPLLALLRVPALRTPCPPRPLPRARTQRRRRGCCTAACGSPTSPRMRVEHDCAAAPLAPPPLALSSPYSSMKPSSYTLHSLPPGLSPYSSIRNSGTYVGSL
jgi:hypothetical protein